MFASRCVWFVPALLSFLTACADDSGTGGGAGGGGAAALGGGGSSGEGGGGFAAAGGGGAGVGGFGGSLPGTLTWAELDGVDDTMRAEVGAAAAKPDDFAVGGFVRGHGALSEGQIGFVIGRHYDGSSNGHYLQITREAGQLLARFVVFSGAGTCFASATLSEPASPNDPVHVLGAFASPDVRVFVDGVAAASEQPCGAFQTPIDPASVLTIGRSDSGVFPFPGAIARPLYLSGAPAAAFSPEALGCSAGNLVWDFAGLDVTPAQAVADLCGGGIDLVAGDDVGPDAADPTFTP